MRILTLLTLGALLASGSPPLAAQSPAPGQARLNHPGDGQGGHGLGREAPLARGERRMRRQQMRLRREARRLMRQRMLLRRERMQLERRRGVNPRNRWHRPI